MTFKSRTFKLDRRRVQGAIRTEYGGYRYASKHEASVAMNLDWLKKAGEIKDWERQFKVEMWACDHTGRQVMKKTHKIDFRVHENDGSFTLIEAKGFETEDYRERRAWLEAFWLPLHLDHKYEVLYNKKHWRGFKVGGGK